MNTIFRIESLSPLYEAVQASSIFPDSKYFTDCTPKYPAELILRAFAEAQQLPGFDLKAFVAANFDPPLDPDTGYRSGNRPISEHLAALWEVLSRRPVSGGGTLLPLPHPYIVPGGRFREIYYWDSYFTMLGLQVSGRGDIIQHMVDNFAYLIDTFGFIPNGNRSYYLGRSQPPFFVLMVGVLADMNGQGTWLKYLPQLEKEYRFWMQGDTGLSAARPAQRRVLRMPDGALLNRYWDNESGPRPEAWIEDVHLAQQADRPVEETYRHIRAAAESGWDFSSRWFADGKNMSTIQTTDLVPVDLNCLLLYLEETLGRLYALTGQNERAQQVDVRATRRRAAVLRYCWDESGGFFFDFHLRKKAVTGQFTLAGVFPLFFNLATSKQAARVAECVESRFLQPGGLRTTTAETGQQWDAPNGWAPLQWMAYKGLQQCGYHELAEKIRASWVHMVEKVYAETGKMMEKYNVQDTDLKAGGGEYPNQDGFGWTNGVYLKLQKERPQ